MNNIKSPRAGTRVENYASLLISVSRATGSPAQGKFNSNYYLAYDYMTVAQVLLTKQDKKFKV